MLVTRYKTEIFNYLFRFLGDHAAADDVFQETFVQVHLALQQFDRTRKFRPWLFTIASHKARDYLRAQARQHTVSQSTLTTAKTADSQGSVIDLMASDMADPAKQVEAHDTHELVRAVVQSMPDHLRNPLILAYFHQYPYKQIAEILDVPVGTVKSRVHAAVAHFAVLWKKPESESNRS